MTAVLDRRTETNGGVPARRAVLRWALRLFRREWRQQLLVLTLITIAVAATIFGAALGTNTPLPANAGFGSANALVTLPGSEPHLASEIAALHKRRTRTAPTAVPCWPWCAATTRTDPARSA